MKNAAVEKQTPSVSGDESNTQSREALSLSPERLNNRASATTQLLTEILERDQDSRHVTHWGINE